jgi:GNAT superfamily N-acetyltransferase
VAPRQRRRQAAATRGVGVGTFCDTLDGVTETTYDIRFATIADSAVLVQHRELMFREMGWECDYALMARHYASWLEDTIPSGSYVGWVATPNGDSKVVSSSGIIVVPWTPGPFAMDPRLAWIVNVYTDHPHRGRGLARRLMHEMHDWCRANGVQRTALNASTAGQPIYESMGYTLAVEPMMRIGLS